VKPWQRPGRLAFVVAAVVVASTIAFLVVNETGDAPVDRRAVAATCKGTAPVREAIAKRDLPGITSSADRLATHASDSGEPALVDAAEDAVREGEALVQAGEGPDFYRAHLAAMEAALSTIDHHCD
jgi:hypothetical protein